MAQAQKGAQSAPEPLIKARVKVEILGSWREPQARRGDVIEVTRAEFDKAGPGVFEDVAEAERQAVEAAKPKVDELFQAQREALRADREASARARAIHARNEAKRSAEYADAAEKLAKG